MYPGPEFEAEKAEKTRDRAMQSSPMDGTHEFTTRSIWGQHFFCALVGSQLDMTRAVFDNVSLYFCDCYTFLSLTSMRS
jgi:hypothetical protein